MPDNFNFYIRAERVLHDLITQTPVNDIIKACKLNVSELEGYGSLLPAVGIKCTQVDFGEDGAVTARGFCEVVATGEQDKATRSAEEIASVLFGVITTRNWRHVTWTYPNNGIRVLGMQEESGTIKNKFVVLVHVTWAVMFSNSMAGTGMSYPGGGGIWIPPAPGADGESAYELAVENGFVGTVEEWLLSLNGTEAPYYHGWLEFAADGTTKDLAAADFLTALGLDTGLTVEYLSINQVLVLAPGGAGKRSDGKEHLYSIDYTDNTNSDIMRASFFDLDVGKTYHVTFTIKTRAGD